MTASTAMNAIAGASYVEKEIRIVVIGKTGSGKSSTANTVLGEKAFKSRASAMSITRESKSKHVLYKSRDILVIDTPGLFDVEISNDQMKLEIMKCVAIASPGLHALILVTQVNRFTEEEKKTVEEFKRYFGDGLGRYLIIIFTGKDNLEADGITLVEYIKESPPLLRELVTECDHRCLAVNNRAGVEEIEAFKDELVALIDSTVKANGGKCYTNVMLEAAELVMKERESVIQAELEEKNRKEREEIIRQQRQIYEQELLEIERKVQTRQREQEDEMAETRRAYFRNITQMRDEEKKRRDLALEEDKRKQEALKKQAEEELKKEEELRAQIERESDEQKEERKKQLQESIQRAEALERKQKEEEERGKKLEKEKLEAEKEREEKMNQDYQRKEKEKEERLREEADKFEKEKKRRKEEQESKKREEQQKYEEELERRGRAEARIQAEEDRRFLGKCADACTNAATNSASGVYGWVASWWRG